MSSFVLFSRMYFVDSTSTRLLEHHIKCIKTRLWEVTENRGYTCMDTRLNYLKKSAILLKVKFLRIQDGGQDGGHVME